MKLQDGIFHSIIFQFSSVIHSCMTLWPHRMQHTTLPCPSPTTRASSNSCPLSQCCHQTISFSVVPLSSCLQSFPSSQQKSPKCSIWLQSENDRMISVHFQGKPFSIIVIQVYAPTTNAEEAEVEWFYEDLKDLLELTSKKKMFFSS